MLKARARRDQFMKAVVEERFGKCPKPPLPAGDSDCVEYEPLKIAIWEFVTVMPQFAGQVSCVQVTVKDMTRAEIRYCLKVCRKLGFTPKWSSGKGK